MLRIVIVTIGLLVAMNGFVIWQSGGEPTAAGEPFGRTRTRSAASSSLRTTSGRSRLRSGSSFLLWGLFQFTKIGLAFAPPP